MPDDRSFAANEGESIVQACNRQGIPVRYGCNVGACRSCKARVVAGDIHYPAGAQNALTDAERHAGYTLLCCARPRSDLTLETETDPADGTRKKTFSGVIESMQRHGEVMVCRIRLPRGALPDARPGQYVDVILRNGTSRSYSISNLPGEDGTIELHIRRRAGGYFSEHVFGKMQVNDVIRLRGPSGDFVIDDTLDRPILFASTGTGFAPVQALVEHLARHCPDREMHLYWGGRTREDLYFLPRIARWRELLPGFRFTPLLSRPSPADAWEGRTGYIPAAVLDDFADLADYAVYACGSPPMIQDLYGALVRQRSLPESAFHADCFFASAPA